MCAPCILLLVKLTNLYHSSNKIINSVISNLQNSEILKNSSVLISGTLIAQLISILLQPLLRRYFLPEDFGVFSVYLSFIGMAVILTTLRYDSAIVLPENHAEAANVVSLSMLLNVTFSFIILIVLVLWGDGLLQLLNLQHKMTKSVLCLIPIGVVLYNTYQIFNYWLIRKKKFREITVSKLVRRGSEGVVQTSFAFIRYGIGLVIGDIVGQIANVVYAVHKSVQSGFSLKIVSWKKMIYVAKRYIDFPKFTLVPALMSAISFMLPPIIISRYYSAEYTGYFDLTKLLLSLPMAFIATDVAKVILQKVAEKFRNKVSFWSELKGVLVLIVSICICEIIIIIFWGTGLFCFFFGDNWAVSGEISKIMVWSFVLNFITSSFSSIFVAMKKIKIYSVWQLFYFVGIMSLHFFTNRNFFDFLNIYVCIEVFCYLVSILLMAVVIFRYEHGLKQQLSSKK